MAASSAVRLRLRFDYPPPSGPQSRMSWILVDLDRCRVIADLCSEIRERFGFGRRTGLDLFLEEFYLPPAESIYLIRDNDSVRVKVFSLSSLSISEPEERVTNGKKRNRKEEDEEQLFEDVAVPKKSKKEDTAVNGVSHHEETKTKNKKKKKKNNKKVEKEAVTKASPKQVKEPPSSKKQSEKSSTKSAGSLETPSAKASKTSSSKETPHTPPPTSKPKSLPKQAIAAKAKESSSSECSSSSEDDSAAPLKPSKPNLPVRTSSIPVKPTSTNSKPSVKKPSAQSSSDSSSSSSSPSPPARKKIPPPPSAVQKEPPPAPAAPVVKKNGKTPESSDSDSSSETELVIRTPNPQVLGMTPRGGGRVRGRGGVRGGFGRARGTPWKQNVHHNYDRGEQQHQDDAQTNRSLVLENPPEPKPRRDYSALPLLAAPPAAGQKIAFKLLELTENYTPEVSDYKEGKIIGFNHTTGVIELEILTRTHARAEPGKFDLVYQNPDGSERVEYAVTLGSQVTERWDSLLEPRLIVEMG